MPKLQVRFLLVALLGAMPPRGEVLFPHDNRLEVVLPDRTRFSEHELLSNHRFAPPRRCCAFLTGGLSWIERSWQGTGTRHV